MSMAAKAFKLLAAAVATAAVAGCDKLGEQDLVGKWEREVVLRVEHEGSVSTQVAVEQMARSKTIELYLRDDGTCTAWENGVPSRGAWTLQDRLVTLKFGKDAHMPPSSEYIVSEDGMSMKSKTSLTDITVDYTFNKTM